MADRIKGITIEIGGDTTGLSKALSSTNKEINNTQSQLRDVERLLKLDPTNTELLKQKQQLLGRAVGETKSKLDALKSAEQQVQEQFKQGKISQDQYNNLQREIAETKLSLESLESAASKSNATISKIGKTAGTIAQKTKGLSMAAGGLLAVAGASAVKAGAAADDINTLSKQTGLSTAEIQKFQYAADIIDVPLETLTSSMARLTRNMGNAQRGTGQAKEAFDALGVSIQDDVTGQLRSNQDVLSDTISALAGIENETQRDAYAMSIFGKSAQDLNPLILGGADALESLGQEAEDAGLILSQDALDAANEFNDSIDKLKATASASFSKIGSQLAESLIPILENLGKALGDILTWFSNLSPETQGVILAIVGLIAAISPIAGLISGITVVWGFLNTAFVASPIGWIVLGIVAAIAALIAIVVLCVKHWDDIKAAGAAAWEWIKGIWDKASGWFRDNIVTPIANFFKGLWDGLTFGAKMAWWGIQTGVISMANFVINAINKMIEGVLAPFNFLIEQLNKIPGVDMQPISFALKTIALPETPKMAKGGILKKGTALVGEAGPELLTVANGQTQVTPLTSGQKASGLSFGGGITVSIDKFVNNDSDKDINSLTEIIMSKMDMQVKRRAAAH